MYFKLNSFNSHFQYFDELQDEYDVDVNIIKTIKPGFYRIGEPGYGGYCKVGNDGIILYAAPTLSDEEGNEFDEIFGLDSNGNIVKSLSKEEVKSKLQQNVEEPGAWGII